MSLVSFRRLAWSRLGRRGETARVWCTVIRVSRFRECDRDSGVGQQRPEASAGGRASSRRCAGQTGSAQPGRGAPATAATPPVASCRRGGGRAGRTVRPRPGSRVSAACVAPCRGLRGGAGGFPGRQLRNRFLPAPEKGPPLSECWPQPRAPPWPGPRGLCV